MRLHPEVPLITLAGRFHLRIALFFSIPGGARGRDDTGIYNGTPTGLQTILFQVIVHQVE